MKTNTQVIPSNSQPLVMFKRSYLSEQIEWMPSTFPFYKAQVMFKGELGITCVAITLQLSYFIAIRHT